MMWKRLWRFTVGLVVLAVLLLVGGQGRPLAQGGNGGPGGGASGSGGTGPDASRGNGAGSNKGTVTTLTGTGAPESSGDGGPAVRAEVRTPHGLAFDMAGNLFIAELRGDRVRIVTRDGLIRTFAGTGVAGSYGDGGPATSARLSAPSQLAADAVGNLIIADQDNYQVRRVGRGGIIITIIGTGRPGFSGDNGPGWRAEIDRPWGLAVTPSGTVYLAANNRVRQMDPDGTIHPFAGTGIWDSTGDGGPMEFATFRSPGGLIRDQHGNVYITEREGHRVRKVSSDGTIRTVVGTGFPGSSGDDGPATAAELNVPSAIAVDTVDNLFIADTYGHRVRMVGPDGIIHTVAGTGVPGFSGDNGPATQAQLNYPAGLAIDGRGDLYIADWFNHRVRKVTGIAAPGLVAGTPLPRS